LESELIELVQDYVRSWTLVLAVVSLFIATDYCGASLFADFRVGWVIAYTVSHSATYGGAEEACVSIC
jgi:hypothetical protein